MAYSPTSAGALLPPSIEENNSIIPEQVPILDWSISAVDQTKNAQGIEYDTIASYGDNSGMQGSYAVTEYAAAGGYGEGDSSTSYGGRRLLNIGLPAAAAAVPSKPQTVLLIDIPGELPCRQCQQQLLAMLMDSCRQSI